MRTTLSFKEYLLIEMTKRDDLKDISAYSNTITTHLAKLLCFMALPYERRGWFVEIDAKLRLISNTLSKAKARIDEANICEELLRVRGIKSSFSPIFVKKIRADCISSPEYKYARLTGRTNEEIANLVISIMAEAAHLLYEKKPVKIVQILQGLQLSEEGDEQ